MVFEMDVILAAAVIAGVAWLAWQGGRQGCAWVREWLRTREVTVAERVERLLTERERAWAASTREQVQEVQTYYKVETERVREALAAVEGTLTRVHQERETEREQWGLVQRTLNERIGRLEVEARENRDEIAALRASLREAQATITELQAVNGRLEAQAEAYRGQSEALLGIMQQFGRWLPSVAATGGGQD